MTKAQKKLKEKENFGVFPKNPSTITKGTLNFTLDTLLEKPMINVSVVDLFVDGPYKMSDYSFLTDEIQEGSYYQEDIEGLGLENLNDEKQYEGEVEIEVTSSSSYDPWSGTTEYDVYVHLKFESYKELETLTEIEHHPNNWTPIFTYSTNNDGDYLKIKQINKERLFVEVGHCCVRRKMFIHQMALTALLFNYEIDKTLDNPNS